MNVRTVQDIVFGVTGQKLVLDVTEGLPSSVTSVEVFRYDAADSNPTLTGSGAIESNPDTTTDDAAGSSQSDARLIPLTDTTGVVVGRSYLLIAASGAFEWVDVSEVASGVSATARHPLHNDFATGSTFQTTRISATVDSSWAADDANIDPTSGPNPSHRVRWVYVVAGSTLVADSYFSLVRYGGKHGVRPQDVELISAGWLDRLPTDHYRDQGRRLIDEAHRAVKIDLHAIWTDDAMFANSEILDELTRYKALEAGELARMLSGGGSRDAYDASRLAYQARFDSLARITSKVPIRHVDGGATNRPAVGLTRR